MSDYPKCMECGKEDLRLLPSGICVDCFARKIADAGLTIGSQEELG